MNNGETTPKKNKYDIINILLITGCVVLTVLLIVKVFFFTSVKVSQTSMFPTLKDDDVVWVSKTAKIQRGDVVVFFVGGHQLVASFDDSNKKLIKRVVAVAGDSIWVENVTEDTFKVMVRCNDTGETAEEKYIWKGNEVEIPNIGRAYLERLKDCIGEENAYTVPEGYFFAMGDNRNNSKDSRNTEVGDVSYSRVFGVVID